MQADPEASKALEESIAASSITDTSAYAAIFVPGGHGIAADGPKNPVLQKLLVGVPCAHVFRAGLRAPVAATAAQHPRSCWVSCACPCMQHDRIVFLSLNCRSKHL